MTAPDHLNEGVEHFRAELLLSLSAFTGGDHFLHVLTMPSGEHMLIRSADEHGKPELIQLHSDDGSLILGLEFEYKCALSPHHGHLSVMSSKIKVWPRGRQRFEPLFRYEFAKDSDRHTPCSHIQVHAHRDAFTHLLGHAGTGSTRSRRRAERAITDVIPAVSEFHFTTGGERFRPCLEDILESLRIEFGLAVDLNGWKPRLHQARTAWRQTQLQAAVRDSPHTAAQTLEEMYGITITLPEHADDRPDRLTKS